MSIKEKIAKIKPMLGGRVETFLTVGIIVLTGLFGFGLGKVSQGGDVERTPVRIEELPIFQNMGEVGGSSSGTTVSASALPVDSVGVVVGSRNSDKYHYPWCSGAKRISDANKVSFASIEDARASGYVPAGNCPGLE